MPNNNDAGPIAGLWPEEHAQELTRLVASGMVYRLIAESLNERFGTAHTKNAIVGKVQRLNLTPPDKPKKPPYVRKPTPRRREFTSTRIVRANSNSNAMRVIKTVELEQYKLRAVELVPEHVSLIDVQGCRYPYGDGPFTFCNHPKHDGSSYCTPHRFLCSEAPRVPVYRFVGRAA
jgi:GcrA cell cycle regulator